MNIAETLQLNKTTLFKGVWNGSDFSFEARTNLLGTPLVMQDLADSMNGRPMGLARGLAVLLDTWDIDFNGDPFLPSVDNLAMLPQDFLMYIADMILPANEGQAEGVSG